MMRRVIVTVFLLGLIGVVRAQGSAPGQYNWEEFSKRIKTSQAVSPLGPDLMGERVSLSNGALSFSATDVSLPGSDKLPVAFTRTYSIFNRKDYPSDGMLADWQVEAPSLGGVFAGDWQAGTSGAIGNRCSSSTLPPLPSGGFLYSDFWQGITLDIPEGGGELLWTEAATSKPTDGAAYYWVTGDGQTHSACLSSIKNGTGEGFLVITADGTKYWFDWMARYTEAPLKRVTNYLLGHPTLISDVARNRNVLYATRVQDRFGNYVEYTYSNAWDAPGKLTQIRASDGRQLTIGYSSGRVSSVSDGTRTWSYAYGDTSSGRTTLTAVTLPDASAWSIGFAAFTNAEIKYNEVPMGEILRSCQVNEMPMNYDAQPVGTITHPSGAIGTFTVDIREHGRSYVPLSCGSVTTTGEPGTSIGNDPNDDVNLFPISAYSFTLKQKQISGPGLTTAQWNYSYVSNFSFYKYEGVTLDYPVCTLGYAACSAPPCTSESCAKSSQTIVTGPNGEWIRYSHGNTYLYNEGKLLKVEKGTGESNILSTATHTYDLSRVDQAYPAKYGNSLRGSKDGFPNEYHRPLTVSTTVQDGATFKFSNLSFNSFAQPLSVKRESSLGYHKTEAYTYENNLSKWVIGQAKTVTCVSASQTGCSGQVTAQATYDAATANPLTYTAFGKLRQTLTYNADGTVATVKDGNNYVTTLSSWYRGIPRTVAYPDGSSQSAVVNGTGWITAVTEENGYSTGYGYDAMGRLTSITYPTSDTVAWNTTTQAFEKVASVEYGIAAGHWRQTITTGNAKKISYFDAQWRPLVTREYDTTNEAGTKRFQRFTYDHEGRTTFASYLGTSDALTTGLWNLYDTLGRPTSVSQDSELGLLTSTTEYLTGFKTRITNPKGQQTTTSYLVYDQPSTDWPVALTHPEGAFTDITRDAFGKPTALKRRDSGSTTSATRSYSYNSAQELCRTVEPETDATLLGYDGAGNLSWSSAGLASTTACETGGTSTAVAARKVSRTYDARNRLTALTFPDGRGNQAWSYKPDGLPSQVTTYNVSGGDAVVNAYSYNKRRLLTGESMTQPGATAQSIGYGYNANGALASHTYPSGLSVTYAPNALGQPTQVGTYATGVSYFPNGAIKQFTYGNGIVHTMTQNARQLPARSKDTGSAAVMDMAYAFDSNGNVGGITDYVDGRQTRAMSYDGLDRLLTTQSPMFGGDNQAVFSYDVLDNLRSFKVGALHDYQYSYGSKQQLLTVNNTAGGAAVIGLGYDVQGNVVNRNGQLFDFDYGNRLRVATNKESYRYDAQGRRVLARSTLLGDIYSLYGQDGVLRRQEDQRVGKYSEYLYLGGSLVARVANAPTLTAPTLTAPSYSTQNTYTVQWGTTTSANRYELQEQANAGSWTDVYSGTATSYVASSKPSGAYSYRIRACLNAYCGSWGTVVTVSVQLPPEGEPNLSVPSTALNGSFTVSWTTVAAATSYTLEQSTNGGAWTVAYSGSALSTSFSNIGAGTFSYRVKACNPAGCGGYSGTGSVTPLYPPATAGTPSVPAQSTTGGYTVSWSAVATASSYQLEENTNAGSWSLVQNAAGTSRAVSGKAAATYGYRLKACNAAGCGGYSGTASVQVVLAPTAAPTVTSPATASGGAYTVSWSTVATATSYRLEESVNSGTWTERVNGAVTSQAQSGKAAGSYAYRARGCNVAGCGPYSATVTTTVPPPVPAVPTNLKATYSVLETSPAQTRYSARWDASSGATYYELNGHMAYSGSNTYYGQTRNEAPNTSAQFYVRACNDSGCSASSAVVHPTEL